MNFPTITLSQILETIRDLSIADISKIKVFNLKEVRILHPILGIPNDFGDGRIIFPPDDRQKIQLKRPVLSTCLVVIPEEQIGNKICYVTILIYNNSLGKVFSKFLDIKVEYTWAAGGFLYWRLNVPWIFWLGENEIEVKVDTITYRREVGFSDHTRSLMMEYLIDNKD